MNTPQRQWETQRAFLAVLRTGSLSGAARLLGIAQATALRRIEVLEQSVGGSLFTRFAYRHHQGLDQPRGSNGSCRQRLQPRRHGATANTAMTHIAINEMLDGKVVDWMELVSDEQYAAQ